MEPKQKTVSFKMVGANDHLPYAKADIVKVSKVSENFSLSFYQVDYQAMAMSMATQAEAVEVDGDSTRLLIPVGKIVLDKAAYGQLLLEIQQITASISQQES